MERAGRRVDTDTWLWGDVEPDYEGELATAVERLAAGDAMRKAVLEKVAERLLDRKCVRVTTALESAHARDYSGCSSPEDSLSRSNCYPTLRRLSLTTKIRVP